MQDINTSYVIVADTAEVCRRVALLAEKGGAFPAGRQAAQADGGKWSIELRGPEDMAQELEQAATGEGASLCWLTIFDDGLYAAKHDPCGVFADKAYMASEGVGGPYEFFSDEKEADKWMSDHGMRTPASCVVQL